MAKRIADRPIQYTIEMDHHLAVTLREMSSEDYRTPENFIIWLIDQEAKKRGLQLAIEEVKIVRNKRIMLE